MAALVPAIRASNTDVGGVLGDQTGAQVSAHGSRAEDGVSMIDGLRIGNMYQSSNLTNMSLSPLLFDQVDIQLSGQTGETGTNGVIMNAIPQGRRQPLQRHRRWSTDPVRACRASNLTDDLKARGPAGRVDDAEDAVRHQRRRRRPDQARQGCGSTRPRATSPTSSTWRERFYAVDPRGRQPRRGHSTAGLRRHLHLRQQRPRHLGDQREAEDLRLVRLSSTRSTRTG